MSRPVMADGSLRIVLTSGSRLPADKYGGTQRFIQWLGKKLVELGHDVTVLAPPGSWADFAHVLPYDPDEPLDPQLPDGCDLVHLHHAVDPLPDRPYLVTLHGNARPGTRLPPNTVFLTADHAERHGGRVFVYHGMDLDALGEPNFDGPKQHLIFLAKAAWRIKNVRGAIEISKRAHRKLAVAGGYRFNLNMGVHITLDRHVRFYGMVDDRQKEVLLNRSLALLFPVLWHEPFGLALIESLYFGNPVFGTPFGSLPEIVQPDVGVLSRSKSELVEALRHLEQFDRLRCHEYACDRFSSTRMAQDYLALYDKVLGGKSLHDSPPVMLESAEPTSLSMDE